MRALSIRKDLQDMPSHLNSITDTRRSSSIASSHSNMSSSSSNMSDLTSESDIKFKLHQCLVKQYELKEAVGLLESISAKNRSAKVNHALGTLYKRMNLKQPAIQAFKDALGIYNMYQINNYFMMHIYIYGRFFTVSFNHSLICDTSMNGLGV